MTVCTGEGSGYVNIRNLSYDDPNHAYSVEVRERTAIGCSCPHATYRNAHCKHQLAVENRPLVLTTADAAHQTRRVATDGGHENEHENEDEDP